VNVPRRAPEFADVLQRARDAQLAREAAEHEWHDARDALRAAAEAGNLPRELRAEVDELLRDEEHHQHRRWRPSPS
jgi:negative regulator of sigma E activity